jgi:hypothetical protein
MRAVFALDSSNAHHAINLDTGCRGWSIDSSGGLQRVATNTSRLEVIRHSSRPCPTRPSTARITAPANDNQPKNSSDGEHFKPTCCTRYRRSGQQRRVTFLTHYNDPINLINATMFLREPPWLTESPRKPGVPEDQEWLPMLTALQSMVDAVNATNPIPGVFRATGHDYRLDLPQVTVAAYDLPEPTPEQWDVLMERFQSDEADRAAAMKLGEAEILDPDAPAPEESTGTTDTP